MMDNDDDDSYEWATGDLPPIPVRRKNDADDKESSNINDDGDDKDWFSDIKPVIRHQAQDTSKKEEESSSEEGHPMILVNLTFLSDGAIHSKFDANSVNDPEAVKQWRRKIEANYHNYANRAELLANRTIIPCGSSVWRPALVTLRNEGKGHYYCPIFPPNK